MKYCSECGQAVCLEIPEGDNLPRYICKSCQTIHYQNPRIVAGCLLSWQDKILLCKRAIEPRYGAWTLPAGFMENDETTAQAAAREAREEANAQSSALELYTLHNLPHINQVYLMFRGELIDGYAEPGVESLEVSLFAESDIPWDEIAFPVIHETLEFYLQDRKTGHFPVRMGDVIRDQNNIVQIVRYRESSIVNP